MLHSLAVANYRSLRDLVLPLEPLNVVTGGNGSGKSNLYRSLRLLAETAVGTSTATIAREGGLSSVLWAGPEQFSRAVKQGRQPAQGGHRKLPVHLRLGFAGEPFSYAIDFGLPTPAQTRFSHDPEIKREIIWHGSSWSERAAMIERRGPVVRARDDSGVWQVIEQHLPAYDSMLSRLADPVRAPEILLLREQIRSWRFYDHFRSDTDAPARQTQIGTRTPVLSDDGHDLASAWQTIREIGDGDALDTAVSDAFPGAVVEVLTVGDRFTLQFHQSGLLRPLAQSELSDGTLRYLLWIAALLTPRPPALMVLNEPETSLHPDLLPALGRLMAARAQDTQLWVTSHATDLIDALCASGAHRLELEKALGETLVLGQSQLTRPQWRWPKR